MLQLLDSILDFFATNADDSLLISDYQTLLYFLYSDYDLLDEDDILDWYEKRVSQYSSDDAGMQVLKNIDKFIKWLKDDN